MLRSLFAAISGLRTNQTMLDVTGNNIANSNTAGFKSSQTVFQDTLSQMLTASSAPAGNRGGTNAMQVGLGVQVGGISTNLTQGSQETTGSASDLMIQGDGYFAVKRGNEQLYTRAGAFDLDADGNLVTLDGDLVLDVNEAPIKLDVDNLSTYNIGADGTITEVLKDGTSQSNKQIGLATFANPGGLEKVGDTMFRATANSGAAAVAAANDGQRGALVAGALEASNVDLAQEFTNLIIAQRGFQANSRVITTSDQVLEELVNIKR